MPAATNFQDFADQLYCSGSEERRCALPGVAERVDSGRCLWYKPNLSPIQDEDWSSSHMVTRAKDVWDPVRAGAINAANFPRFDRQRATSCVRGKHIYLIGESTTRDLYYEFSAMVGLSPDRSYCMNIGGRLCHKKVRSADGATEISYQFISKANVSKEVAIARNLTAARRADVVFVYCMMYDHMAPLFKGPDALMGEACMALVDEAVLSVNPSTPVFLLGPIYAPGWVSPYANRTREDSPMRNIFDSINRAAGIRCERTAGGMGDYRVVSTRGVRGPIDRYNVIGKYRKKDMIHPQANAHVPNVQMMLNFLCPDQPAHHPHQGGGSSHGGGGRNANLHHSARDAL